MYNFYLILFSHWINTVFTFLFSSEGQEVLNKDKCLLEESNGPIYEARAHMGSLTITPSIKTINGQQGLVDIPM